MRDEMPRLLVYHRVRRGASPLSPPLWVAIVSGSLGSGGDGVVVSAPCEAIGPNKKKPFVAGDNFMFGGADTLNDGCEREMWGLDAVPDDIAAAWMKLKHLGKLDAS